MTTRIDPKAQQAGEIARLLSYIVLLIAAAVLFVAAGAIPTSRFETLGAGAFPRFIFAAIIVVALIACVDALRRIPRGAWGDFANQTMAWARRRHLVFVCLGAFGAYLAAVPWLGFALASFGFVLGLQLVLMPRRPATLVLALCSALTFSFGLNWLFAEVFTVFLPRGVF